MAWKQKATRGMSGDGVREKAPAGNHPARLVALIDMGTQLVDGYQGAPDKEQHRAYLVWELVSEQNSAGENFLIAIDLNISLNEKAKLRKWVEARTGRPIQDGEEYDISQEVGKPCLLTVTIKNDWPRVEGMAGVPKAMKVPEATHELFSWSLEEYEETGEVAIPDWIPWLFGRSIVDHINDCKEIAEGQITPGAKKPAPAPFKAPAAPPKRAPKPPAKSPPQNDSRFWVALSDGADPVLMTLSELKHQFETVQGVDWKQPIVCLDGSEQWLPVFDLVPESSGWSPF